MRAILLTAAAVLLTVTTLDSQPGFAQTGTSRDSRALPAKPAVPPPVIAQPVATAAATPAAPTPAAPVGAEPQSTTATFGDWILRCQRVGEEGKQQKSCEVAQSVQVQGQSAPFAQIAVGRRATEDPLRVTVLLPSNVSFPSSVSVATDEKDSQPLQLAWRRCVPAGCLADVELPAETLSRWRGLTENGRVAFQDSTGRSIILPVSFRGLGPALDALNKS